MSIESVKIYDVSCAVRLSSGSIGVTDFTITHGINSVPTGTFLLALSSGDADGGNSEHTVVYTKDDPATDLPSGDRTYDLCKEAQDNRDDVSIYIRVSELTGQTQATKVINLSGWKVTHVALQPQTRLSPGGVEITVCHPMCELLESPGFFYAPGADYEKLLKDKEPENIVEAGDAMLDAIYEVISGEGYTAERMRQLDHYEALVTGAKVRLGDYIECDSSAEGFPYEKRVPANLQEYYKKAARLAFALNFSQGTLAQSVPLNCLLNLCNQIGLYMVPYLKSGKKAQLKVLNPWLDRTGGTRVKDEEVYSAQTSRDSDPICGIRLLATPKDSIIISTLTDIKPTQKDSKTVGGEVMYYFNDMGRIINTTLPSFLSQIFSIMYRLYNKDRVASLTDSGGTKAKHAAYDDPTTTLKSLGMSQTEARSFIDDLQNDTAKAMFVVLHRRTQRSSVTRPLIDDDFPDIGSYVTFTAGTGGDKVTGMLVQNILRGSVSHGICTITHNMAYCGETACETVKGSGGGGGRSPLKNEMWSQEGTKIK